MKKILTIKEAESLFKGAPLISKKTKTFFYWLYSSLPATFDIDFKYKVIFNIKNIEEDFTVVDFNGKTFVDWEAFYYDVVKKNFSERSILMKAKSVTIPNFKVVYALYNSESTDKTLNPKRSVKYDFRHTVTLEAIDKNKKYNKKEIAQAAQDFVNKFEPIAYSDTKYYKITK